MSARDARSRRRRAPGTRLALCLSLLQAVALLPPLAAAPASRAASKEYQLKAAFLFNFTQFVDWPEVAFLDSRAPICIGILGEDPFGEALDDTVRGEQAGGRDLVVRRSRSMTGLRDCQLLFISSSERTRVPEILSEVASTAILTVSEVDGFTRQGGVINFFLEGNKVRFEINAKKAQAEGLHISSQLLSLGRIATSDEPGSGH